MGVELLKIGIKMRKGVIFTIRGCVTSFCSHPFLVFWLFVLLYIYRPSPFFLSLFIFAAPIVICAAVLLGTLLYFGQPNIPEIEIEEKTNHDVEPIRAELSKDAVAIEKNESCFDGVYGEKRRDEAEHKPDEICSEGSVDVTAPLDKERSRGAEYENGEISVANRELDDDEIAKHKNEWNGERFCDREVMESRYASVSKGNDLESEYEKSEVDSCDSVKANMDSLESSGWKKIDRQKDEEDDEDDGLDSGSDLAESSSPDASMVDIIPMLDELHPLLDEEAAQLIQMSRAGSEAASVQSSRASTSSIESVDETDNQEDSEVAEDDREDDDDDDEDDAQGGKEDGAKSAITWTEEDQKNLMELGSSEIERNRRLENLIMRRRTRNFMSMVPEINLIDLESSDFPTHIAPISTMRKNPFDSPLDSYDNSGLPPAPGSAPSVLLPRRNPFDIPYDSAEEKPNPTGDDFKEELQSLQSREPLIRRHESFNVGPSYFAPNRRERQHLIWRPYFVPERIVLEESSYSGLQRQSSEMSDSKESSTPETESDSSVEDVEDQELEEDDPQCQEVISGSEILMDRRSWADTNPRPVRMPLDKGQPKVEQHRKGETVSSADSNADYHEANEMISTSSAGGSTPHFYNRPHFDHLVEVQVPNTPVEPSANQRGIQNIYIPEVHDLDRDVSGNTKSKIGHEMHLGKSRDGHVNGVREVVERPSNEAKTHEDVQSTKSGKERGSDSKSSSSSSSSSSASSDSEENNKQMISAAKRRLSTPF